jgi:hypothetical protein
LKHEYPGHRGYDGHEYLGHREKKRIILVKKSCVFVWKAVIILGSHRGKTSLYFVKKMLRVWCFARMLWIGFFDVAEFESFVVKDYIVGLEVKK